MKAKANWKEFRRDQIGRWYQWGDLLLCVGDVEQEGHWHISISHPYRYPTWDEIYTARYDFCPHDIDMAIILPKKTEYVTPHRENRTSMRNEWRAVAGAGDYARAARRKQE